MLTPPVDGTSLKPGRRVAYDTSSQQGGEDSSHGVMHPKGSIESCLSTDFAALQQASYRLSADFGLLAVAHIFTQLYVMSRRLASMRTQDANDESENDSQTHWHLEQAKKCWRH